MHGRTKRGTRFHIVLRIPSDKSINQSISDYINQSIKSINQTIMCSFVFSFFYVFFFSLFSFLFSRQTYNSDTGIFEVAGHEDDADFQDAFWEKILTSFCDPGYALFSCFLFQEGVGGGEASKYNRNIYAFRGYKVAFFRRCRGVISRRYILITGLFLSPNQQYIKIG